MIAMGMRALAIFAAVGWAPILWLNASALAAPCITAFLPGSGQLGFRNACAECKLAEWNWGGGKAVFSLNGKVHSVFEAAATVTKRYEIPSGGELKVPLEDATGRLLSEQACTAQ